MNLYFNFLGKQPLSFICYFCPHADGETKDKGGLQFTSSQDWFRTGVEFLKDLSHCIPKHFLSRAREFCLFVCFRVLFWFLFVCFWGSWLGGLSFILFCFVFYFCFDLWNPLPLKHMLLPSFLNLHKTCVADVNPLPFLRARHSRDWSWAVLHGKLWSAGTAGAAAPSDKHLSCFLVSFLGRNKSTGFVVPVWAAKRLAGLRLDSFCIEFYEGHHKPASVCCNHWHNGLAFAWSKVQPPKLNLSPNESLNVWFKLDCWLICINGELC